MKSVLLYTVHKSGSMFLHSLLGEIAKAYDLQHYSLNYQNMADEIKGHSWLSYIEAHDGVFGPIRINEAQPHTPADLSKYSVILHTRDPRDMLTSLYYSFTYSHKTWKGGFNPSEKKRKRWEEKGIDRFVVNNKNARKKYEYILSDLFGQPGLLHITYEEMVTDYGAWLTKLLTAFSHLPFPERMLKNLFGGPPSIEKLHDQLYHAHKDEFSVDREDIYANKRQITPGDHRRKLQPETIEQLNRDFSEILHALNYPED